MKKIKICCAFPAYCFAVCPLCVLSGHFPPTAWCMTPSSMAFKKEASEDGNVCKICDKKFRTRVLLKQHGVTHTADKDYECDECGKKFKTSAILYNHRGVHNPLQCELCTFKVAQKACVGPFSEIEQRKKAKQQIVQEKVVFKKPHVSDIYD